MKYEDRVDGRSQVIARYTDGTVHDVGRVIALHTQPAYIIERADGSRFSWNASMVTDAIQGEGEDLQCARCGKWTVFQRSRSIENHEMDVCSGCAADLGEDHPLLTPKPNEQVTA
jgi:NAD-dependent SIR2 family protein deacetylase